MEPHDNPQHPIELMAVRVETKEDDENPQQQVVVQVLASPLSPTASSSSFSLYDATTKVTVIPYSGDLKDDCFQYEMISAGPQQQEPPSKLLPSWCTGCLRAMQRAVEDRSSLLAMMIMAFSALIYSFQYLDVKKAGKIHGSWTIAFFRGLVGSVAALTSALLTKSRKGPLYGNNKGNIKWLVLRGFLGGITIISAFLAVKEIELSDAAVIMATSTVWTAVLAVFVENGSWSKGDTLAAVFCTGGVVLVTKPGPLFPGPDSESSSDVAMGVICALVAAISQAGVNMTIRKIKDEDTSVITLYAMVGCTILSLPGMLWEQLHGIGEPLAGIAPIHMVQLYSTGLLSYGAQMLKTLALQISKGVGVLIIRYLDTVFSYVWDVTFFNSHLDVTSVCGGALIISGCVMDMFAKSLSQVLPTFTICPPNRRRLPFTTGSDDDGHIQAPPA